MVHARGRQGRPVRGDAIANHQSRRVAEVRRRVTGVGFNDDGALGNIVATGQFALHLLRLVDRGAGRMDVAARDDDEGRLALAIEVRRTLQAQTTEGSQTLPCPFRPVA
ncbi:hypothetical protein D3C71_1722570 [compost metagenome]